MAEPHRDNSGTPLPAELGVHEGSRVYVAGAPEDFGAVLGPQPADQGLQSVYPLEDRPR
jgi:hypothetical protein